MRKRTVTRSLTNRLVNPVVRRLLERGLFPRTHALLETTGRRTGEPRRVPIGNGLRGEHFWIVTEHGWASHYVKNVQADPRVRVKVGRRWLSGTAHVLPDDDPRERLRWLRRPVNDTLVRAVGTQPLTIRIDLDRADARGAGEDEAGERDRGREEGGGTAERGPREAGGPPAS